MRQRRDDKVVEWRRHVVALSAVDRVDVGVQSEQRRVWRHSHDVDVGGELRAVNHLESHVTGRHQRREQHQLGDVCRPYQATDGARFQRRRRRRWQLVQRLFHLVQFTSPCSQWRTTFCRLSCHHLSHAVFLVIVAVVVVVLPVVTWPRIHHPVDYSADVADTIE